MPEVQAFDKDSLLQQRVYLLSIYFTVVAIPFRIKKETGSEDSRACFFFWNKKEWV